jgi:hypothetical protein
LPQLPHVKTGGEWGSLKHFMNIDGHQHVQASLRRRNMKEKAIAGIEVGSLAAASALGKGSALHARLNQQSSTLVTDYTLPRELSGLTDPRHARALQNASAAAGHARNFSQLHGDSAQIFSSGRKPNKYSTIEGALAGELGGLRKSFEQGPSQDAIDAGSPSTLALPKRALPWGKRASSRYGSNGLVHSMASAAVAQILEESKRSGLNARMKETIMSPEPPGRKAAQHRAGRLA